MREGGMSVSCKCMRQFTILTFCSNLSLVKEKQQISIVVYNLTNYSCRKVSPLLDKIS